VNLCNLHVFSNKHLTRLPDSISALPNLAFLIIVSATTALPSLRPKVVVIRL